MGEGRRAQENKSIRQSMREMGLDDVIEDGDREELLDAYKTIALLRKQVAKLTEDRDAYKGLYRRAQAVMSKPCLNCKYAQKKVAVNASRTKAGAP